jgi:transposase
MQRVSRRHYTDDFKAQAIALAESSGPAKAARQVDMSVKTLGNWLDASRAGRPLSSPQRKPVRRWSARWPGCGRRMPRSRWSARF